MSRAVALDLAADRLDQVSRSEGENRDWRKLARDKQKPPDGDDWQIWLLMAGRGFGKTWTGANWIIEQALSQPDSEWAVIAPTFRDVRKTCIEESSGILSMLQPGELVRYRRNELQISLSNGSTIYGYSADQPERIRGANLHGAWCEELGCLPGDTLVRTEHGQQRIDRIRAGQQVWTRNGLRKVLWSGPTRPNADLWEITAGDRQVVGTPDHRVWTNNRGFVELQHVRHGDILVSWGNSNTSWKNSVTDHRPGSNGQDNAGDGSASAITRTAAAHFYTGWSGKLSTDRYQTASRFTTGTRTRPTTSHRTWKPSPTASTINDTPLRPDGKQHESTAQRPWSISGSSVEPIRSIVSVPNAKRTSPAPTRTPIDPRRTIAVGPAVHELVVNVSRPLPSSRREQTYDLTVEGDHEFFANDVLVHNSWRYEETWHEGLIPALRKGINPRVVVTTTPRPTKLIKHLTKRDDGSVYITRGSTWENREHLSEAALRGLQARYGGTRLGRQELEGELLEDIEGALWTRSVLDETRLRHRDEAPDLVRIVVGVDPAVTSKPGSDEHGIVVCGMDAEGHGYVLGDFSLQGTPNTAVRRAIQAFNAHEADLIVGEVNNGGDFIESLVRTVSADVPYKSVRATRGKLLRAEPVSALYEQKRVHHVGALPELEDQMCDWTPLDLDSPDRLDAMVWAMTEMFQLGGDTWSGMYGHRNCPSCERGYMPIEGRTKCPHCGHPIAEVA